MLNKMLLKQFCSNYKLMNMAFSVRDDRPDLKGFFIQSYRLFQNCNERSSRQASIQIQPGF